jgi:hypothetical protein
VLQKIYSLNWEQHEVVKGEIVAELCAVIVAMRCVALSCNRPVALYLGDKLSRVSRGMTRHEIVIFR